MSQVHRNTLLTAVRYGGHFTAKLAEAALAADPDNRERLFQAFPRLLIDYGPTSTLYRTDLS